jgi:hypothetical protein
MKKQGASPPLAGSGYPLQSFLPWRQKSISASIPCAELFRLKTGSSGLIGINLTFRQNCPIINPMEDRNHFHLHTHQPGSSVEGSPHDHIHPHTHEHIEDPAKITALLSYMVDHNRQHGEEIHGLAHSLYHAGQQEAADLLDQGLKDFEKGNEKLAKALNLLRLNSGEASSGNSDGASHVSSDEVPGNAGEASCGGHR